MTPRTWTTVLELTVGAGWGGGVGREGQRGKHWDNCNNNTTMKKFLSIFYYTIVSVHFIFHYFVGRLQRVFKVNVKT